jgi:hypothetical protein
MTLWWEPLRLPTLGTIVTIPAASVYLGDRDLTLRLSKVGNGDPVHPRQEWVTIEGKALNPDGTDRGFRSALVSVDALSPLARAAGNE